MFVTSASVFFDGITVCFSTFACQCFIYNGNIAAVHLLAAGKFTDIKAERRGIGTPGFF